MEENSNLVVEGETSLSPASIRQESRNRKQPHPSQKMKTISKKLRKNQDGIPTETDTNLGNKNKPAEDYTKNLWDEDKSPQRYTSTQFGSKIEALMAKLLGTIQTSPQQQSNGQSELNTTLEAMEKKSYISQGSSVSKLLERCL